MPLGLMQRHPPPTACRCPLAPCGCPCPSDTLEGPRPALSLPPHPARVPPILTGPSPYLSPCIWSHFSAARPGQRARDRLSSCAKGHACLCSGPQRPPLPPAHGTQASSGLQGCPRGHQVITLAPPARDQTPASVVREAASPCGSVSRSRSRRPRRGGTAALPRGCTHVLSFRLSSVYESVLPPGLALQSHVFFIFFYLLGLVPGFTIHVFNLSQPSF